MSLPLLAMAATGCGIADNSAVVTSANPGTANTIQRAPVLSASTLATRPALGSTSSTPPPEPLPVSPPSSTEPASPPDASSSAVVATITMSGGLTVPGRADPAITVFANDTARVTGADAGTQTLALPSGTSARLRDSINRLDLVSLRASKPSGTCPRSYDSQAPIYDLIRDGRDESLDSCTVAIDHNIDPFLTLDQIHNTVIAAPAKPH